MKIPKKIEKLITQREKYARDTMKADVELSMWLEKNNIPVEYYDVYGGCEAYCNPSDSAERIRSAILQK